MRFPATDAECGVEQLLNLVCEHVEHGGVVLGHGFESRELGERVLLEGVDDPSTALVSAKTTA